MWELLKSLLFGRSDDSLSPPRFGLPELSQRLGMDPTELKAVQIAYSSLQIPKRGGGVRTLLVPADPLKQVQRRIHRRLLRGLRAHPNATGFERGHSILTNALPHVSKDLVIRLDIKDFFGSIRAKRVHRYFRFIGYDESSAAILTRLCTQNGSLPQGAPTSPRLSNLLNYRLDVRLTALAEERGLSYSRYADDITFSANYADLAATALSNPETALWRPNRPIPRANPIVHAARRIIEDEGYRLHTRRKLRLYRPHHRQMVTGLVVNHRPNLPRATRRRLRAIDHHLRTGRPASLTAQQLAGWQALQAMIQGDRNGKGQDMG